MNKYTVVNHELGLEVHLTAETRKEARELAVLKARKFLRRTHEHNSPFYWTIKQAYHHYDYHVLVA